MVSKTYSGNIEDVSNQVEAQPNEKEEDFAGDPFSSSGDVTSREKKVKGHNLRSRFIDCSYKTKGVYNTVKLHEVAKIADRYLVSDRIAAAIATATLIDFKIISKDEQLLIVDPNKVRRSRKRVREAQINEINYDDIQGLYFDGRKDQTLEFNGSVPKKKRKIEHISLLQQPGSFYLGHKSVSDGCAVSIGNAVDELLQEKSIPVSKINVIGCDGTVVNTGVDGGIVRFLELKWKKTLHWVICMLHLNELPLRALITKLDGATSGSKSYSGEIGKRLTNCEILNTVKFVTLKFEPNVPNLSSISNTLSSDQKYLFDMCTAISKGFVSEKLALRSPGALNHSRWTTTANRCLRLYVSDPKPSDTLKSIVQYIMFVYAPMMFQMKYKPSIVFGAVHLANMIQLSRFLPINERQIVEESIQNNGYFSHPEHITLAMLNDDDKKIRVKGWRSILTARQSGNGSRVFAVPPINFKCRSYITLSNTKNADNDPPILREIAVTQENIEYLSSAKILEHDFGSFLKTIPIHTQAVERSVKLIKEASEMVGSEAAREGLTVNRIASRNIMPKFDSKQDYNISKSFLSKLSV